MSFFFLFFGVPLINYFVITILSRLMPIGRIISSPIGLDEIEILSYFLYAIDLREVQSFDMFLLTLIDHAMESIKVQESTPNSFL